MFHWDKKHKKGWTLENIFRTIPRLHWVGAKRKSRVDMAISRSFTSERRHNAAAGYKEEFLFLFLSLYYFFFVVVVLLARFCVYCLVIRNVHCTYLPPVTTRPLLFFFFQVTYRRHVISTQTAQHMASPHLIEYCRGDLWMAPYRNRQPCTCSPSGNFSALLRFACSQCLCENDWFGGSRWRSESFFLEPYVYFH